MWKSRSADPAGRRRRGAIAADGGTARAPAAAATAAATAASTTATAVTTHRRPLHWARLALLLLFLALLGHALSPWAAARLAPQWGGLELSALRQLDRLIYDLQLAVLAPRQAEAQIVVVDIDERSLAAHGRWPWDRDLLARLLDLTAGREGARLIGLDLVLAEPERAAPPRAGPPAVASQNGQSDGDARLAEVLRRRPVVLGFHLSNEPGAARIGQLPPPLAPTALLPAQAAGLMRWAGHGGNLQALQAAAHLGAGHINATVDPDGRVRRLPLLVQHDGGVHGALALAMARAVLGRGSPSGLAELRLQPADGALHTVQLHAEQSQADPAPATQAPAAPATLRIPLDAHGQVLVPYRNHSVGFVRISAADVLANRVAPNALRDKLVLVGVSAPGLIDQHPTPLDEAMPGTLVHAHLLAGLLSQQVLAVPAGAPLIEAAALLLIGVCLVLALPRLPLRQGVLLTAAVMGLLLGAQTTAWLQAGWVLPLAACLLLPPALLGLRTLQAYEAATGARRQLTRLFGQYVPPELVDQMSLAPERYTMQSRSAELTVLFADVHGFSDVAQHMAPAELGVMMNLIFSHLTDVVRAHRGTLDKYIGDSVMAFWGAPLDDPDHATRAVTAALAMRERLPKLHAEMARNGWPPLGLNIGINTGIMVVGDMGSRHRRAYTVMGDAVNLAARLQALCSRHGLGLVIGDATRKALGERLCLALGDIPVRGRDAPIPVWHPLRWQAGQNRHADQFYREWLRMRLALESGHHDLARRMLDALQANPAVQPLCDWQRQRLMGDPLPETTVFALD